jgi:hypothetical protein
MLRAVFAARCLPRSLHLTAAALVWLALVLLPLRGWASVVMHAGDPARAAAAQLVHAAQAAGPVHAAQGGAEPASMPCHAEAAAASPSDAGDPASSQGSCQLCDLCHAGALPAASAAAPAAAFVPPRVAARASMPAAHQPAAPDDPPRP